MSYLQTFRTLNRAPTGFQADDHRAAVSAPSGGFERAMLAMVEGWARYADAHAKRHEAGIGSDGVLGPEWAAAGMAIRRLLNGETGRLDCGTIAAFIDKVLRAEGFDPDLM